MRNRLFSLFSRKYSSTSKTKVLNNSLSKLMIDATKYQLVTYRVANEYYMNNLAEKTRFAEILMDVH